MTDVLTKTEFINYIENNNKNFVTKDEFISYIENNNKNLVANMDNNNKMLLAQIELNNKMLLAQIELNINMLRNDMRHLEVELRKEIKNNSFFGFNRDDVYHIIVTTLGAIGIYQNTLPKEKCN